MSLIQDALKRKAEENPEITPMKVPDETTGYPVEQRDPKAPQVMLLILSLAAFLAVLVGLSLYLIKPKQQTVPMTVKEPATPAPAIAPEMPVSVPTQKMEVAVAVPAPPPPVKEEPVPVEVPVVWPALSLTGIAQGDNQSLAILNGKVLPAGRKLGEVTVAEVREHEIVVEYRGERRVMYLGE